MNDTAGHLGLRRAIENGTPEKAHREDEYNFIDLTRIGWMTAKDRVIVDDEAQGSNMIQGVFQLQHRMGVSLEDFRSYWLDVHAPIVRSLPGLRYYVQCLTLDDTYGWGDPRWDGVEEILV